MKISERKRYLNEKGWYQTISRAWIAPEFVGPNGKPFGCSRLWQFEAAWSEQLLREMQERNNVTLESEKSQPIPFVPRCGA